MVILAVVLVMLLVLLSGYVAVRLWPFVLAVLGCLFIGVVVEQGPEAMATVVVLCLGLGVVFYGTRRFSVWLQGVIERGMAEWDRKRELEDVE